jgi:hypothetical protein
MRDRTYLLLILLAGCSGAASPSTGPCAGTGLAGSCVDRFFAPFTACWKGGMPPCTQQQKDLTTTVQCWPSGAQAEAQTVDLATMKKQLTWTQSGVTCMTGTASQSGLSLNIDGATLAYDHKTTGDATCPDGTTVHLGVLGNPIACPALVTFLSRAACTDGTCP